MRFLQINNSNVSQNTVSTASSTHTDIPLWTSLPSLVHQSKIQGAFHTTLLLQLWSNTLHCAIKWHVHESSLGTSIKNNVLTVENIKSMSIPFQPPTTQVTFMQRSHTSDPTSAYYARGCLNFLIFFINFYLFFFLTKKKAIVRKAFTSMTGTLASTTSHLAQQRTAYTSCSISNQINLQTLNVSARISAPRWFVRLERPTKNSLPRMEKQRTKQLQIFFLLAAPVKQTDFKTRPTLETIWGNC